MAAAPITLSGASGANHPSVSVDSAGVAHFVWNEGDGTSPAVLHYCQVPAGGAACTVSRSFTPDALAHTDLGVAQVLTPSPGSVILVQHRCCNGTTGEDVAYQSTDGGNTFSGPTTVGTIDVYDAQVGPGSSSVSMIDDTVTAGTSFQAGPLAGPASSSSALVGDGTFQSYFGSIAYLDANTPMVAFTDHSTVFTRRLNVAGGDPNVLGNWNPAATVAAGDEPKLVTGPSGTFLLSATPSPAHYVVRKLGGDGVTFAPPVDVTDTGIFRDFTENAGGGLRVVWRESGALKTRCSADGTTWTVPETVAADASTTSYHNRLSTGADGSGWVVSDSNSAGPIVAYPVAPCASATSPGPGGTPPTSQGTSLPLSQVADAPPSKKCLSKHSLKLRIRRASDAKVTRATIFVGDKQVKVVKGKQLKAPVNLRNLPHSTFTIRITVLLDNGLKLTGTRTYTTCGAGPHSSKRLPPSPCASACGTRPRAATMSLR